MCIFLCIFNDYCYKIEYLIPKIAKLQLAKLTSFVKHYSTYNFAGKTQNLTFIQLFLLLELVYRAFFTSLFKLIFFCFKIVNLTASLFKNKNIFNAYFLSFNGIIAYIFFKNKSIFWLALVISVTRMCVIRCQQNGANKQPRAL